MATLQQIRQRVSRKIKDPDNTALSAANVDAEINRAIRFYSRKRFWFNEELATITLTANAQIVPSIPSDLISELQVNGLMVIDGQEKINLIKILPDQFFEMDDDQIGEPVYYTYRDGEFLLLPTPDQAYTLKLRYLKSYADLVSNGDTNDFTNNAEDLIMLHAIKNIYAEDKDDPSYASSYAELERVELLSLMERTENLNSSGVLTIQTILE